MKEREAEKEKGECSNAVEDDSRDVNITLQQFIDATLANGQNFNKKKNGKNAICLRLVRRVTYTSRYSKLNFLILNIRGINDHLKHKEVKDMVFKSHSCLLCPVES